MMSVTLGAAYAATYRSLDLPSGRASVERLRVETAHGAPTWLGDTFVERGELPFRRERALQFLERGQYTEAIDLLLGAVACVDAAEGPYRACIEALQRVCLASGRLRALASAAWYLGERVGPSTERPSRTHVSSRPSNGCSRTKITESASKRARRSRSSMPTTGAGARPCGRPAIDHSPSHAARRTSATAS